MKMLLRRLGRGKILFQILHHSFFKLDRRSVLDLPIIITFVFLVLGKTFSLKRLYCFIDIKRI